MATSNNEPLGSNSPAVLSQNATNLDKAVNQQTDEWVDRFGIKRKTIYGALKDFQDNGGALAFGSEVALLAYIPQSPNVLAVDTSTGKYWFWDGSQWAASAFRPASWSTVAGIEQLIRPTDVTVYEKLVDEEAGLLREYTSEKVVDLHHEVRSNPTQTVIGGDREGGALIRAEGGVVEVGALKMRYSPLPGLRVIDEEGGVLRDLSDPGAAPVTEGVKSVLDGGIFLGSRKLVAFANDDICLHIPSMVTDRLAGKEILATLGSVSTPAQMSGTNTLRFRIGDFGSEAEINLRTDSSVNDRRGGVVKLISVPAATSQKNIRVLMIGDSIGNRQGPLLLSQFLSNYGFTVQFIGTLNTSASASAAGDATGELAECREGWESGDFTGAVTDRISIIQPGDEATYLSQSKADKAPQNPFLRAATSADPADSVRNGYVMDFAFYQSRFSLDAPDVVIYSTGTNDVRDRPASTIYDDVLSNELLLLRQLRSAWPAAKIIRMLPGTSMDPQRNALWTSGYAPVLRAIAASATTLADGGLIIAPTWALVNHDCGYSASYTETDPDTGFGRLNWSDKVHPVRASRQLLYKSLAPYVAATFLNLI